MNRNWQFSNVLQTYYIVFQAEDYINRISGGIKDKIGPASNDFRTSLVTLFTAISSLQAGLVLNFFIGQCSRL